MGIRVQQALLSSLLIAALFSAPYLQTVRAGEEVALSTEKTPSGTITATTTEVTTTDTNSSSTKAATSVSSASARTYSTYSDQPVFLSAYVFFPSHALRFGPKLYRTTALRDDARTFVTVLINQAPTTVSITADISALGGSTEYPLHDVYDYIDSNTGTHTIHQFQGDWFTVQSSGASGTTTIPIAATDENGDVLTSTITVVLDNTLPTFTIPSITRTATTTLAQGDVLYFSGSLDGTGTEAKPYLVYVYELASDGETVISRTAQDANHPSSLELFALRGGSFSNVPLQIYTIEGTDAFPDDVAYLQYVFSIDDEAGNLITATSSLVSVLPSPPEPEGPKISNVLFLPGIKGSRLYSDDTRCGVIGCDNKLWDPLSSEDVRDLYLTPEGKSSRSDIYTKEGDIIDVIPGKRIYASFIDDMNELQASSTYNGGSFTWKAAAYDWRLSLDDIVSNGTEHSGRIYYEEASSTPYIEQTLRQLVASSTTGKVTIIAHSNGGLVAKALLKKLGDVETARLVDKIIFVGVPQTGAPHALGGLLFGDREGLPLDLLPAIATPAVARGLAEYSPMAYHLMPSDRYLKSVQDSNHSVMGFSGAVMFEKERAAYGPSIDTITELDDFLLARDGGRVKPEANDATTANVLSPGLISYANTTHDSLDSWTPPTGVTLYQIAGWGADTISGVDFYDEKKLLGATIGYKRQYRPVFVEDGDGVVPVPSALMMSSTGQIFNYWINLRKARIGLTKFDHGNILEVPALKDLISKLVSNTTPAASEVAVLSQPQSGEVGKKLIFQLHSPLTLGIYDANGNYTGLNTDGSVSENVSGAQYGEFGDVKYLIAPAGQKYTLTLHGQSAGTFSLDIQEQTGNTVTTSTTIADVPTTAQTTASLTITNGVADASSLTVDENGDGSTDIELTPVIGETTTYTAPVAEVAESSSGTSSGSKSTSHSATEAVTVTVADSATVTVAPTATQIEAVTQTEPGILSQIPALESATSTVPSSAPKKDRTQTASVYEAFAPITHLIQAFLHAVWTILLRVLNSIF